MIIPNDIVDQWSSWTQTPELRFFRDYPWSGRRLQQKFTRHGVNNFRNEVRHEIEWRDIETVTGAISG